MQQGPDDRVRLVGSWSQWAALALCALLGAALFTFVDLAPQVDDDFFFSSEDPQLQQSLRIEEEFGENRQVFVAASADPIQSRDYIDRIYRLTEDLRSVDGVADARSITHGLKKPKKIMDDDPAEVYEDIEDSPFWTQLLLAPDRSATFVVLRLDDDDPSRAVQGIDAVLRDHNTSEFRLWASGVPYVSEHIRQALTSDLRIFSIAAFMMFAVLVGILFRSVAIVLGTMTAALTASFGTFLGRAALGMETDILAPNLWTIAFVLTLSHVVYLAAQWQRQAAETGSAEAVRRSVTLTGPASAWSLAANLLGFATLIFVSAKPLRQFGISGAIAAVLAIVCAYFVFPPFLKAAKPRPRRSGRLEEKLAAFFTRRHKLVALGVVLVALLMAPFAWVTNSDPSLPSYFDADGAVGSGLRAIDALAGVSPLDIVVGNSSGAPLSNDESFARLEALHDDLWSHDEVGSVLSLPLLMEETDRRWYSFLFSWNTQIKQLEKEKNGNIGDAFISDDRKRGRYIVRLHELGRERPRAEIISELKDKVHKHGFEPQQVGGLYILQGELAELVEGSVLRGLGGLLALFFVIVYFASRSLRTAAVMAFCLTLTPFLLFGIVGLTRMPLDIISAPAANVALPLGIDEMIHLAYHVRRRRKKSGYSWKDWSSVLEELWRPILAGMLIVVSGFALFLLSSFPPTQRLGILVCAGAAITDLVVLLVLPALVFLVSKKRPASAP